MSFSFDPTLASWRDHARLALGDVESATPLLENETIDAKLTSFGFLEGLAQLADGLAMRAAQDPSRYAEGAAGLAVEWTQKVGAWRQLAADCRAGRVAMPVGAARRSLIEVDQLQAPDRTRFRPD